MHFIKTALVFARASAGMSIEARIPMMAITTRSSIRVKPQRFRLQRQRGGNIDRMAGILTIRRGIVNQQGVMKLKLHAAWDREFRRQEQSWPGL
jgi:hypothetical protein